MRVLLFDTTQSYLTPGGKQVHVQKLFENLPKVGVDVDYAKWWDPTQKFDIIHFFGYNAPYLLNEVKSKNKRAVLTQIMDAQTNFSSLKKELYSLGSTLLKYLPGRIKNKFHSCSLNYYDGLIYVHENDRKTAEKVFHIDKDKSFVIPHACDEIEINSFIKKHSELPQKYLISVGSIVRRKRPALLAKLAITAKTPVVFVGGGNQTDPYFIEFMKLVDNQYVYYYGGLNNDEKNSLLFNASGFVLLSEAESGCIAVFEAASLGLPLLLSDLLWAKCYESPKFINYCNTEKYNNAVSQLKSFYEESAKRDSQSFEVLSWRDIASLYKKVYEKVL